MTLLSTDPIDILLGADGDLDLTAGGVPQFSRGSAGVVQAIQIVLNMVAGEWFLDLDAGVPYFERDGVSADQALLGQKFDRAKVIRAFTQALENVSGVVTVLQVTAVFDGPSRVLSIGWTVLTSFGDTVSDTLTKGA